MHTDLVRKINSHRFSLQCKHCVRMVSPNEEYYHPQFSLDDIHCKDCARRDDTRHDHRHHDDDDDPFAPPVFGSDPDPDFEIDIGGSDGGIDIGDGFGDGDFGGGGGGGDC